MTKMKNTLLLTILASFSVASFGQDNPGPQGETNIRNAASPGSSTVQTFNNRYEGVRGNPFLIDKWCSAEIALTRGDTVNAFVKLDIHADEIWSKRSNGDSIIVDRGLVKALKLHDPESTTPRLFFFDNYEIGYFEVLYAGKKLVLACKRRKDFQKASVSGVYDHGNTYDEFSPGKTRYYLLQGNRLVSLRKNTIRDLLGKNAKRLADDVNLDFKTDSQVVDFILRLETNDSATP
jgi:hypothetical protein